MVTQKQKDRLVNCLYAEWWRSVCEMGAHNLKNNVPPTKQAIDMVFACADRVLQDCLVGMVGGLVMVEVVDRSEAEPLSLDLSALVHAKTDEYVSAIYAVLLNASGALTQNEDQSPPSDE